MRIGKTVMGIVFIVIGGLLVPAGALGIAAFGTTGTLQVASSALRTDNRGYALVADVMGVEAGFPGSQLLGTTTLGARTAAGKQVFVGLASGKQVNDYLFGVPFEAVRQDGTSWQTASVPGIKEPAPPAKQKFWIRHSTGSAPSFEYTGGNGAATFVVMNADASPRVAAVLQVSYQSALVFPLSVGAVVLGLVLIGLGIWLLLRSRSRRADPSAADEADTLQLPQQPAPAIPPPPPPVTDPPRAPGPASVTTPVGAEPPSAAPVPDDWFRQPDTSA